MRFLVIVAFVSIIATAARAGSCDYVIHWDAAQFQECIAEYRKEVEGLKLRLATAELEAANNTKALCLLATDLQGKIAGVDVGWLAKSSCPSRRHR